MKLAYTKMTVQCERFTLNEAISAGCTLNLLGLGLSCDNCEHSDQLHRWDVYYKDKDGSNSFSRGDDYYAISHPVNWNRMSAQCRIQLVAMEGTIWKVPNATGDIASNGNVGMILVPSNGSNAATQVSAADFSGDFGASTVAYNQTS